MYPEERQQAIAALVGQRGPIERHGRRRAVRRDDRDGPARPRRPRAGRHAAPRRTAGPCRSARWPWSSSGWESAPAASPSRRPGSPPRPSTSCPRSTAASCSTAGPRPPPWPSCCRPTGNCSSSRTRCRSPPAWRTRPGVTVHLLGGRVRGVTQCAVGETASASSPICGSTSPSSAPTAITAHHGFTTPDEAEALVKRAMVARRSARRRARRLQQARPGDPGAVRRA